MRNAPFILLLFAFLLSIMIIPGCITQTSLPTAGKETISNVRTVDLDSDGIADLVVYDFKPVINGDMILKRQVAIAIKTISNYSSFKTVTATQLTATRASLDTIASDEEVAFSKCAANAGLKNDCLDLDSCTVLCSSSFKCKKVLDSYPIAAADSVVEFVNTRNLLEGNLIDVRNSVLALGNASEAQKNDYLNKLHGVVFRSAQMYSNPFYARGEMLLCTEADYGLKNIKAAADPIGTHTSVADSYEYFVTVSIASQSANGGVNDVELSDTLPTTAIKSDDDIASNLKIKVSKNGSEDYSIAWKSERATSAGNMMAYRFSSSTSPDEIIPLLVSPGLSQSKFDLFFLAPAEMIFNIIYIANGNFYIALGASIAIFLVLVLFSYSIFVILYHVMRARMKGENFMAGVRRALGKTEMRWKSDLILGILLLAAGWYISTSVAIEPTTPVQFYSAVDYFANLALGVAAASGLAGVGCVFLGIILVYSAIENKIKVTLLENLYGMVIREERDESIAKAAKLKNTLAELQKLVDEYSAQEFDVSEEYDVLSALPMHRIDDLAKKNTPTSKEMIDEYLAKAESALERLMERKKSADENWPKWSEMIDRMLAETNEVYLNSLVTIPASLRTWVLGRYVKEKAAEGVVFDRDSIKKKIVSPQVMVSGMIQQGLLEGAVVIENDKVILAQMKEGSATVPSVLSLKLRGYMRALAKSLGQHEPTGFAAVGDKDVLVMLKDSGLDAMVYIPREKFKDAVEEWKKKVKMLKAA